MALRKILTDNDETLRKVSREVTSFNGRLHDLLDDMHDTLKKAEGVGLAAPQVGILRRVVIIIDPDTEELHELINPVIVNKDGEQTFDEACLSVPGFSGTTKRPAKVTAKAFNRYGEEFEITGEEVMAVALCHETDHLDGILYTDIVEGKLWKVKD